MRSRYANRDRVASLDPLVDFHAIYSNMAREDFPWDVTRALELALYRTFCIPSIAALLDQTGEFRFRTQRRYDDTALLLGEILELGTETPEGRAAVSRLNRIHARFEISNDDFLYTLATFVFVPLRWLDRWGWRPLLAVEREAAFRYYARLGQLMGISGIPGTLAELEAFFDAFEREHFAYGEPQARTAVATRELPASWLPPTVAAGLHARARVERLLPPRRRPTRTRESRLVRSYPDGFTVADLGPQGAEPVAG